MQIFFKKLKIMHFFQGDNGKNYDYIVKYGEDVRQDERIQQIFSISSRMFEKPMVTYKVIPIDPNVGLLEFVPDTRTLKSVISSINDKIHNIKFGVDDEKDFLNSWEKQSSEQRKKMFQTFLKNEVGEPVQLERMFHQMSSSFHGFHFFRNNFMTSHAKVCAVG